VFEENRQGLFYNDYRKILVKRAFKKIIIPWAVIVKCENILSKLKNRGIISEEKP